MECDKSETVRFCLCKLSFAGDRRGQTGLVQLPTSVVVQSEGDVDVTVKSQISCLFMLKGLGFHFNYTGELD